MAGVKNVSLTTPPPADLQAQQLTLQQQMEIAKALMGDSLHDSSPIIHTGGGNQFARDIPNLDPIGKVAQAYFGRKGMDEANKGMGDVITEGNRRTRADVGAITDALFPQAQPSGMPPTEGQPDHLQDEPDYVKAMRIANNSTMPGVNAMGAQLMSKVPTPEDTFKLTKDYTPESVQKFTRTLRAGDLVPKKEVKIQDNMMVTTGNAGVEGTKPLQTFNQVPPTDTGIPPLNKSNETGYAQGLGTYGNTTPAAKYEEQYTSELTKQLAPARAAYLDNIGKLNSIAQIKEQAGGIPDANFGTVGGLRNSVNKFIEALGGQPLPETDKMEVLQASIRKFLLDDAKKLYPVSNTDLNILSQAVGSENMTKRGLLEAMDVMERSVGRAIGQHRDFIKDMPRPANISTEQHMRLWAPDYTVAPVSANATNSAKGGGVSSYGEANPKTREQARRELGLGP